MHMHAHILNTIKNARPATIVGWILSLIGITIGLVNVGTAFEHAGSSMRASTHPVTVEQGMRISTKASTGGGIGTPLQFCTLGYIDHAKNIGYTSAHCLTGVDEGTYTSGGVPVTTRDQRLIGHAYPNLKYASGSRRNANDVAVIKFSDNVTLGSNRYSGDTILSPDDVNRDTDIFCAYGATTQKTQCGTWDPYTHNANRDEFNILGANTIDGDSGSGVWVQDENGNPKGVFGISRGRYPYPDGRPNAAGLALASVQPEDFEPGVL